MAGRASHDDDASRVRAVDRVTPARREDIPEEHLRAHLVSEAEAAAGAQSKSLVRGLAILAGFSGEWPVLGIAEMADVVGFSRSTTHRYMTTLAELGYLVQEKDSRRYRIGPRSADIGLAALECARLRDHQDLIRRLRGRSGCTATIAALSGARALIADVAHSRRAGQGELMLSLRVGMQLPLHSTALGKALLSAMPAEQRRETIMSMTLAKTTSATIGSKRALAGEAEAVEQVGFALEQDEHRPRLLGLAAPVAVDQAPPIAIGIALHAEQDGDGNQASELADELAPILIESANELAAAIRAQTQS